MHDFKDAIKNYVPGGLIREKIRLIQVNIGRRCNLNCAHCHLACTPDRTEEMDPSLMDAVVDLASGVSGGDGSVEMVDIIGGSPELHANFCGFISALRQRQIPVQVRTNFAALLEPKAVTNFMEYQRINSGKKYGQEL